MFTKCSKCKKIIEEKKMIQNLYVCPHCNYHGYISAPQRIASILDEGSFTSIDHDYHFHNPLDFPDYKKKYELAQKKTGLKEAILCGRGSIFRMPVLIGAMDSHFMMASMGSVVGEIITNLFELGKKENLPVILFSASGGARMQEGIFSLMQMAKTASAVSAFSQSGGLFLSVLTNPTTGGVSASFAFLGDIILAEPKAIIGFAGQRVIEQTINEKIPDNFQTSEYLLEHGFIDTIVERRSIRASLRQLLLLHSTIPA